MKKAPPPQNILFLANPALVFSMPWPTARRHAPRIFQDLIPVLQFGAIILAGLVWRRRRWN
jgi:hypothetical protein